MLGSVSSHNVQQSELVLVIHNSKRYSNSSVTILISRGPLIVKGKIFVRTER